MPCIPLRAVVLPQCLPAAGCATRVVTGLTVGLCDAAGTPASCTLLPLQVLCNRVGLHCIAAQAANVRSSWLPVSLLSRAGREAAGAACNACRPVGTRHTQRTPVVQASLCSLAPAEAVGGLCQLPPVAVLPVCTSARLASTARLATSCAPCPCCVSKALLGLGSASTAWLAGCTAP